MMTHPQTVVHLSGPCFTIDDVFRSVILAIRKSSDNHALRAAYDQILDDLDDDKELTFAHIQTICARQFGAARIASRTHLTAPKHRAPRRAHRRPNLTGTTSTSDKEATNSPPSSATPMVNSPGRFSAACLAGAEWTEPASVTALFMAAQKHFPNSVPIDTDDDDDTDYDAAAAYESDDITWVSFMFVGSVQGYLDLVSLLLFLSVPLSMRVRHSQPLFATRTRVLIFTSP
jgi:hypothetical protein